MLPTPSRARASESSRARASESGAVTRSGSGTRPQRPSVEIPVQRESDDILSAGKSFAQRCEAGNAAQGSSEHRGLRPGVRVRLFGDALRRGELLERAGSGYWAVQFADKVRNVFMGNLEALPDEVQFAEPFHMSDAPLNAVERIKADRQALIEQKGVRVGARVRLLSDSSRCGVVESLAGSGRYAVRFADRVCNFYLTNLIALPEEVVPSHFLLQKAPPPPFVLTTAPMSNEELRLERSFRKKRGVHAGDRVGLVSDSRVRGVVEVALGGGWFSVRFSNKSRILSKNQLDVLPSYDPTFKHSKAPPNKAEDMRKSKRTKKRADDRAIEEKRLNLVSL